MRYDEQNLHSLIDLKAGRENNNIFLLLMKLGKKCVDHNPKARPEMVDVFRFLTGKKSFNLLVYDLFLISFLKNVYFSIF